MERGDMIRVSIVRRADSGPEHFGIYDGYGGVYHFRGTDGYNGRVVYTSLYEFEDGGKARRCSYYDKRYDEDEIIRRAQSKVGSSFGGYNLITNNCEHFAIWCISGDKYSRQTGYMNGENDKRDIVERAIDNTFNPLIKTGDKIDKALGWGDYCEGEKSLGEEIFETVFIDPLDRLIDWIDKW